MIQVGKLNARSVLPNMSFVPRLRILLPFAALLLTSLAGASAASALPAPKGEAAIARCIHDAANGAAWLERTLWGLRDQEAGWSGAEMRNTNGTHDLGPMQINSSWVPRIAQMTGKPRESVRRWLIHDPCFNVAAARWIFLSGLAISHDYWKAIGIYHSPTGWRQLGYSRSVADKLVTRFGRNVFVVQVPRKAPDQISIGGARR